MIPCLYTETETAFTTNGIGKLCDALSCYVTEKRNGSYELKMGYPSFGIHAEDVVEGNIILAKPSERATAQPFRIYKITTPLTGLLEVQARHIQYQENFITVSPFSAQGSQAAMAAIKSHTTTDCPFDFWTDIDSSAVFSISAPATVRGCLGGMDGSMLDTYGGEYEWDMYTAMLHGHRGADHGVKIVYGKNLIDFKMERSIENMITGVHPYWKHSEDGTLFELPEKVVTVEHDGPYEKISVLDCTSHFEEKPTEAQLRNYVNQYLQNTSLTEPDIDIKIDFFQLWQTPGYQDIAEAERVSLCDTVHVYISKLGLEVSCKVTETEYDVLLERYKSITLSNAAVYSRNSSLSGSLGSLRDEAQLATEAVNRVETQVTDIRTLTVQQEYFNALASGLFGLHYSSGVEEDGSTIRYAHTSERIADSAYAWKSGIRGFFISTDGGQTWRLGWDTTDKVVKTAVEAVGVNASFLGSGTLRTALVKILGTENFYWEKDAIIMVDGAKQIKIGQYRNGDYGIAVSTDGGTTWTTAIDFDGLHGGGGQTIIYQDTITKAGLAPNNPSVNDLWIDTIENRLKLWNGTEWVNIGYEPTEPDPTDPDTPGGGDNPDDPGGESTDPENPTDPTDPTNPDEGGDDSGGEDPGTNDPTDPEVPGDNEGNPGDEPTPEEGG
ncbi:MAG: Prophage endopeptidase tail [bacterium ADurb.Bin478]|jgi:phage minor structural protein|nr:MAG: Prophage endopeptidase tail [bacterium ADurb.Bin478]